MTDWPDRLSREDAIKASTDFRRLIAMIESGEIGATTGRARALLRRIEGAVTAIETLIGSHTGHWRMRTAPHQP